MLEGLVATLLNRFLGMYVKNFDTKQLNIGIWSGDVKLRNLELRREALDQLHLPLNVVEGYLGDLTLSIPWSNLRSKPVKVNIEDVFLLAAPRMDASYDPEDEKKRAQAIKLEKLDSAELLKDQSAGGSQEEQLQNQSFTQSLVNAIVDNLQIVIKNVHFRYEDSIATPGTPFAVGVTVKELSAVSTDESWMPTFVQSTSGTSHKLATLESLAMYWNTDAELFGNSNDSNDEGSHQLGHEALMKKLRAAILDEENKQHVLKPVSCRAGIELDKTGQMDRPRLKARFLFDELGFVLDDQQYRDSLMLMDLFHYWYLSQENRALRPACKPKEDPKAWFRYGGNVILGKIKEKNRRWTWEYLKERRDDRKRYVTLFKMKKSDSQMSPDEAEAFSSLEEKYSYEDLRFWRSLARSQLRKERVETKQEGKKKTWGEWLWGSKKEAQQPIMTEEQRKELFEAIDWDEKKAAAESIDVPKDWVKFQFDVSLRNGNLTLKRDPHRRSTEVIKLMFDSFRAKTRLRPDSFVFDVDLGGLRLYDGTTPNTLYPQVVKVKDTAAQPKDAICDDAYNADLSTEQEIMGTVQNLFHAHFESNPLDGSADSVVAVKMKSIEIIYNPQMVVEIVNFFQPPQRHMESINALLATAGATVAEIRQQTRAGLEFALTEHKTCDIQLDIQAPLIIVPDDVTNNDPTCLIIDAGHIGVGSELAPKEAYREIQEKQRKQYSEEDYERLESLMYDKFSIKLQHTQVLMGRGIEATTALLSSAEQSHHAHIIDHINIDLVLELCIVPKSTDLTRTRLSGHLPELHASISDQKYKNLMRLIDIAIPNLSPDETAVDQARDELAKHPEKQTTFIGKEELPELETDSVSDVNVTEPLNKTQKQFEFNFTVDVLRGSLYRSGANDQEDDTLLCELLATHFQLNYYMRPFDMVADVLLKSLEIEDHIETNPTPEFRRIVSSKAFNAEEERDLFHLKLVRVNASAPEVESDAEGVVTDIDLSVSTINLVVTRRTLLTLLDFVFVTFVDSPSQKPSQDRTQSVSTRRIKEAQQSVSNAVGKVQVNCKLEGISLILNDDGLRLATLSMTTANVNVVVTETMHVQARLGSLNLFDDLRDDDTPATTRRLMSIEGDDFAEFSYKTFSPKAEDYPGYNSEVFLRSGSIKVNFIEEPYRKLVNFLVKFGKMQAIFNAARSAAANQANQLQETASFMRFDVVMKAPILVFPKTIRGDSPKDYITANLGEIYASNSFEPLSDEENAPRQNIISAGIRHIKLSSNFYYGEASEEMDMMENVDVDFNINYIEHQPGMDRPDMLIDGKMSPMNLKISQSQLRFVMQLAQTVPTALIPDQSKQEAEAYSSLPSNITQPAQSLSRTGTETQEISQLPTVIPTQENVWSQLEMKFKVDTIGLELILAEDGERVGDLEHKSLSKFALNQTHAKLRMTSDGTLESELLVRSFIVLDSREQAKTRFRKIVSLIDSDVEQEFMASVSLSGGDQRHCVVMFTIDSPRIIFALDYIFALQKFVQEAFAADVAQTAQAQQTQDVAMAQGSERGRKPSKFVTPSTELARKDDERKPMVLSFRINVVNAQMILVANPTIPNTEAIVLGSRQVILSQQNALSLQMAQVGMFLCRMDKFDTSRLRILDDFALTLAMDQQTKGGSSVRFDLHLDPLVLRLSLRDILLAIQIVNKASDMLMKTREAVAQSAPKQLLEQETTELAERPRFSRGDSIRSESSRQSSSTRNSKELSNVRSPPSAKVVESEELVAQVDGVRVVIIAEGHELPLFDWNTKRFDVVVRDWSSHLSADATFSTVLQVYNFSKSAWEPLIEPWQLGFHMQKDINPECLSVEAFSHNSLEVTVSSATIALASKSLQFLNTDEDVLSKPRGSSAPYRLRNYTGFDMKVWNEYEEGHHGTSYDLSDGQEYPWQFEDPMAMRENLTPEGKAGTVGVKLEASGFNTVHAIPLIREGEKIYSLKPRKDSILHRLLVEVTLAENNVKYITFRSPLLVENQTQIPIEFGVFSPQEGHLLRIEKIAPGEQRAAPVGSAYMHSLVVRPDQGFGYDWSNEILFWKDLLKRPTRTLSCRSDSNPHHSPPFYFQMHASFDEKDPTLKAYPHMRVKIFAPIEIQNLLPFDFKYRIYDKHTRKDWTNFLRKGGISPVHVVELSHLLLLNVDIEETPFRQGEFAIINGDIEEDFRRENSLTVDDGHGTELRLGLHYFAVPDSGGAFKISVYSPYVILNMTGLNLALKSRTAPKQDWGHKIVTSTERGMRKSLPYMYSYKDNDRKNRTVLKVDGSRWTKPQSFDAIGSSFEVSFPSDKFNSAYHAGITVTEGQGKYLISKVITITPRFILKNKLQEDLIAREPGSSNIINLRPGDLVPLHFLREDTDGQLCLSFPGLNNHWSAPFYLSDLGSVYVKLSKLNQSQRLLKVELLMEGATIFMHISAETANWPYSIRNESDTDVMFYQANPNMDDDDDIDNDSNFKPIRYRLPARSIMPYAWDYPASKNKNLVVVCRGKERYIRLAEIGNLMPMKLPPSHEGGRPKIIDINIVADGPTQTLVLSNFRPSKSMYRQPTNISSRSSLSGFEVKEVQSEVYLTVQLKFAGLGVSLVNQHQRELVYMTFRDIAFRFSDSKLYQTVDLVIKWIQCDNQLYGGIFPILVYPSVIPKTGHEMEAHPIIHTKVTRVKDDSYGVYYIKYATLLCQQMTVELDEDFIFALLEFLKVPGASWTMEKEDKLCDESLDIPEPSENEQARDVYFELLHLHPMQLDISFVRTERVNVEDTMVTNSPLMFFVNILTMSIGNVNDAPIRFNALMLENARVSLAGLYNSIKGHYTQEFVGQIHLILGSADFLGNPVGLFNTVSSAVADVFYEPYQGLVMTDRPHEQLGIGIAKGASSFVKKSVFGLSDSVTKFTGSVAKGFAAATLDKSYQDQRRMSRARNKPKHALYGIAAGGNAFAHSMASGIGGLARHPLEGAEKDGFQGFVKGIGKGILGLSTKPVIGAFDFASSLAEGVRNTTTVFDANDLDRVRYPRFIGMDGIVRPYSQREALGQHWLKTADDGAYFHEDYIAHLDIPGQNKIVMLTYNRIMILRSRGLKSETDIRLTDIQTISKERTGMSIALKGGMNGPFIPVQDEAARNWFYKQIAIAVNTFNEKYGVRD